MPSEELQRHVGVGDNRASLLPDCLADDAGALDVACLALAYSEDVSDALDAVHVARCVVCWLAAAIEGVLYSLVDYLCELCYGEVDNSNVLVHIVLNLFVWPQGQSRTALSSSARCFRCQRQKSLLQILGFWRGRSPSPLAYFSKPTGPHGWVISVILSLRPGTRQDPLKNSSGLSRGPLGLSATIQHAVGFLWERRESNPRSRLSLPCAACSPIVAGRAPPVKQTLYCAQNTACSPVHVYLVSFVVAVVADLSGSVASSAGRL